MRVPLLDLGPQLESLRPQLEAAVLEVLGSTRYIGGPRVEELERAIAAYCGAEHAVGVSSGTDALLISLMALGVGAGDLVLTTPFSFFATAGTIARLGARPAFVDVDPATYNMDPAALAAWFEDDGPERARVKAILPIHLFGQCADMTPILATAAEHGVPVIEDAAQAIGARYPGLQGERVAGSMGLAGCFSFFPSKNLGGIGDGGMVVTSDADFAERLGRMRNHGGHSRYEHGEVGGNFRLDPIQAAALLVKLPHLEEWHAQRRANAAYYDEHLCGAGLETPQLAWGRDAHIYNQYVIALDEGRDELRSFLHEREIGCEVYYPIPLHQQECFASLGHSRGAFPRSEEAARRVLALPIFPELSRSMQDFVIESIGAFQG